MFIKRNFRKKNSLFFAEKNRNGDKSKQHFWVVLFLFTSHLDSRKCESMDVIELDLLHMLHYFLLLAYHTIRAELKAVPTFY